MAPVVGTPAATATTPGTLSVPLGTEGVDWNPGDSIFVLAGTKQMSTETFGAHTDWDTILSVRTSTIVAIAVFHRIMQTGDPTSFTLNTIGSNDVNMAIAWVDPDLDGTDAIDVIGLEGNSATGDGALTIPGITAGTSKRVYAAYVGFDNDATSGTATGAAAFTHPGTFTELLDAVTDTGADLSLGAAYLDAVTGATGDLSVTGTPSSLSNYRCLGFAFSVNPSAGGGGTDATVDADADDAVADAAGDAPAPAVAADATVSAPAATASGQAPLSGNETSAEVTAPAATGAGDAPIPGVSTGANATVDADADDAVADGAGDAPAPAVTADAALTAPAADAAGAAPAPAAAAGAGVTAPAATGAGDAPAPAVSSGGAAAPEITGPTNVTVTNGGSRGVTVGSSSYGVGIVALDTGVTADERASGVTIG
jgi:hypothetical protein